MAAPTNYYVDPAGGSDVTGDGSLGNPWASVQHALNTITRDTTNGDQVNVRDTAVDVLSAALDLTAYGTPIQTAPLILRGYTAVANDGGVGEISGGGSVSIYPDSRNFVVFADLHLHSSGSNAVVNAANRIGVMVYRCEIDNTTNHGVAIGSRGAVVGCRIHNCGNYGIVSAGSGVLLGNFLKDGVNKFVNSIRVVSAGRQIVQGNIISLSGGGGIRIESAADAILINNTIWTAGGSTGGRGITVLCDGISLTNNIVEGFSGVGERGITSSFDLELYGFNKVFNCTSPFVTTDTYIDLGSNEVLAASPFTDPANDDFSITAELKAAGWPSSFLGSNTNQFLDPGAAQREEAGGLAGPIIGSGIIL